MTDKFTPQATKIKCVYKPSLRRVCERWLSIFGLSVVASALWPLIVPWISTPIETLNSTYTPTLWHGVLVAVIIIALLWKQAKGRLFAFLGLRHFLTYPPTWLAGLIAAELVLILSALNENIANLMKTDMPGADTLPESAAFGLWVFYLIACICTGFALLICPTTSADPQDPVPVVVTESELHRFSELRKWLVDDAPIDSPAQDGFGHARIAARIVTRLSQTDNSPLPTIAVVGGLGAGKSTVRRLCEHYIFHLHVRHVRIVPVSLWAYDSQEAAVSATLDVLVHALRQEVSSLEVSGVPRDYLNAIDSIGPKWARVFGITRPSTDPEGVLERFDRVAATIGMRFVLWVEDLERFSENEATPQTPPSVFT